MRTASGRYGTSWKRDWTDWKYRRFINRWIPMKTYGEANTTQKEKTDMLNETTINVMNALKLHGMAIPSSIIET
jgi:hypothetical protein